MDELIAQYTGADEDSRLTRQNITKIEFDTTMHLLAPYLKSGANVCEFGAATGRYSLSFAKMGCNVTSVELVPDQVEILKKNAERKDLPIDIHLGSACHVPFIESDSQDLCVILGPLYHLKTKNERDQAISEVKRILKPNGILAVAYISRFFVAGLFAQKFPHLVTPSTLSELYTNGTVTASEADRFFRVGYFASPEEIEHLLRSHTFNILDHAATDGFGRYISEGINSFTPSQYQTWLEYHLNTCRQSSLLGSSNHGLVVAKKTI
ncbi:class I SAM-dependent methyltransferase [Vibrio sp. K4]|uniref:class I SAM-dependent methyltransferase n=1 Tax=Vibrio sp. K4 TaxID=3391579 RepID=UPI003DA747DA